MRIAIITFSDSCPTQEVSSAIERAGMVPVLNDTKEKWADYEGYIILGEFSLESLPKQALDPMIQYLRIQNEWSKPILGISSGAEMLVRSGLVPGIENDKPGLSICTTKENEGFMRLSENYQYNAFTRLLTVDKVLNISSAETRRFKIPPALNLEMEENGLNVFRYCNAEGRGGQIAAVSNKAGNVMAILPAVVFNPYADLIFSSMKQYISVGYKQRVKPLYYYPR